MNRMIRRILIFIVGFILVILILAGIFLSYISFVDYQPPFKESLGIKRHIVPDYIEKTELCLLIWNVGYCGLGKEMDFFYEGGEKMRPDVPTYQGYLNNINSDLMQFSYADFILLQEVDLQARRSYYINQVKLFENTLIKKESVFAMNYNVPFVPMPVLNPMARVKSGLQFFSSYKIQKAYRYGFPVNFAWPLKLFMHDRCFSYCSFRFVNDKNLIILNVHNSAFDNADKLREIELLMIKAIMLDEYEKGNYIIAGGDWNQNPPGFDPGKNEDAYLIKKVNKQIAKDYFPEGWLYAYDPGLPTNRNVNMPYTKGKTPTTLIDFYVVSPNIEIVTVNTIETDFLYSDHQPVLLKIKLKQEPDSLYN